MDSWQLISIVLAVLSVALAGAAGAVIIHRRSQEPEASRDSSEAGGRKAQESYALWLPLGIAIGISIGSAMHNLGAGIAIGVAIGVALGSAQGKLC